jgi:DNA-binding response OmpR family regulator
MAAPYLARLLLVDDDSGVRASLSHILQTRGYAVDLAASGREALDKLRQSDIDVMLLDLHLPDQDGLEIIGRAGELRPDLAIIVLTGHATLESAITAVKAGRVVDYLHKPAGWREILRAVTRACQRRANWRQMRHEAACFDQAAGPPEHDLPAPEPQPAADWLTWPPLKLDTRNSLLQITLSGRRTIRLSRGETAVLAAMMAEPEAVHSCATLVAQALGYQVDESEARPLIRPYIFRLRQKIEPEPARPQLIRNVRGRGYALGSPPPSS